MQFCHSNILVETKESLAEANEDAQDTEDRYTRVVTASILLISYLLQALSRQEADAVLTEATALLGDSALAKLYKASSPKVRSAVLELVATTASKPFAGALDPVLKPAASIVLQYVVLMHSK